MNAKISVFFVLKRSHICYYIICMTVPTVDFLGHIEIYENQFFLISVKPQMNAALQVF